MTDAALQAQASLGSDALHRFTRNKAAVVSSIYLALVVLICIIGPWFTGHDFRTIYKSYVRVPPSIEAYPAASAIEAELKDSLKRAKAEIAELKDAGSSIQVTLTNPDGVDERVTRFLDRSDYFDGAKVIEKSAGGTKLVVSADIQRLKFLLGTDISGRDVLTRTLMAGRVSLAVGLMAGLVAVVIGVIYGAVSGFVGGRTDEIMMRFVDILYSLPFTFFVIMLVVFFGRNFLFMFAAIGAVLWLDMARIVRGQTLSLKRREFVQAAEALGVTSTGILFRHIIPNLAGPVVVFLTLLVPQVIILESFLSYLGLGVQEPMSSWGVQISEGARNMEVATWLLAVPSFFLTSTLFALNFVGDGLRDALDPHDR
jgi:oligopeptide transport system permease protein